MTSVKIADHAQPAKDYLWLHLRNLPYFRALLRAVEARFYQEINLPSPTLDLGCGDGHFASIAFDRSLDVGTDPWWGPLQQAHKGSVYQGLTQSDGAWLPFPRGYFASAVSNSVLEHIPDVESVLVEVARVLQPGASFAFCVPNHRFLRTLSLGRWLDRLGLSPLGNAYRAFFNKISRHYHCDPPHIWESRLEAAGFRLEKWWHYFSPSALQVLEWGHYFGLPSLISKALTGRWIICSSQWNLWLTHRIVKPYYAEPISTDEGVYSFFIATRQ